MLRMFSVPPSATGFPSSPVTVMAHGGVGGGRRDGRGGDGRRGCEQSPAAPAMGRQAMSPSASSAVRPSEHGMVTQVAPGATTFGAGGRVLRVARAISRGIEQCPGACTGGNRAWRWQRIGGLVGRCSAWLGLDARGARAGPSGCTRATDRTSRWPLGADDRLQRQGAAGALWSAERRRSPSGRRAHVGGPFQLPGSRPAVKLRAGELRRLGLDRGARYAAGRPRVRLDRALSDQHPMLGEGTSAGHAGDRPADARSAQTSPTSRRTREAANLLTGAPRRRAAGSR